MGQKRVRKYSIFIALPDCAWMSTRTSADDDEDGGDTHFATCCTEQTTITKPRKKVSPALVLSQRNRRASRGWWHYRILEWHAEATELNSRPTIIVDQPKSRVSSGCKNIFSRNSNDAPHHHPVYERERHGAAWRRNAGESVPGLSFHRVFCQY